MMRRLNALFVKSGFIQKLPSGFFASVKEPILTGSSVASHFEVAPSVKPRTGTQNAHR
jgi:hypothetical protein